MTTVTNELLLEHLKRLQEGQAKTSERLANIEDDMRIIKGHMASFMQGEVRQDGIIASLQLRLERIERRLELTE